MGSRGRILIVDDEANALEALEMLLHGEGYTVASACDGYQALAKLDDFAPDVLLTDLSMPGMNGMELMQQAGRRDPALVTVVMTAFSAVATAVTAMREGAADYVSKPIQFDELMIVLDRALERHADSKDTTRLTPLDLLGNGPDAFIALSASGQIDYVNQEAERVLGAPAEQLVGQQIQELLPGLPWPNIVNSHGHPATSIRDVEMRGALFAPRVRRPPEGSSGDITLTLRDVTARRKADAQQLDLYAVIAHELRSPLSAMLVRNQLILRGRRGPISPELSGDLVKMEDNIRTMVASINDFLELARLDAAAYVMRKEAVDLGAVVDHTLDEFRPLAEVRGLTLRAERSGTAMVSGDRSRLAQVVTNLVANAIKFTPSSGVITVKLGALGGQVEARITDTGRGIPSAALPHLFQRYARALSGSDHVDGTGLGLMIVRELIEAHDGTVGVVSEPGKGSTFWFRLPELQPAASAERPAREAQAAPPP